MCIIQQEGQIRLMSTTIMQDLFWAFLWAPHEYEIVSTAVLIEQSFQRSEYSIRTWSHTEWMELNRPDGCDRIQDRTGQKTVPAELEYDYFGVEKHLIKDIQLNS